MTTTVSVPKAGHDINYMRSSRGGCGGAMKYYTEGGEPPGQWDGRGADQLGLRGQIDMDDAERLFMHDTAPDGQLLAARRNGEGTVDVAVARAVRAWQRKHPFASAVEVDEVRARERAKARKASVPYYDQTVSFVKSASLVHMSYRLGAMRARQAGDEQLAARLDARADAMEQTLMDAAHDGLRWLEANACYTRTGYHSSTTGEYRDAAGFIAGRWLHHLSRDGDPHLHVHIAINNLVQRADGEDEEYRRLFSRALFRQRLGVAPVFDRFAEKRLREDLGFVMVPRADGNGCEIGGVSQADMDRFSSRAVAIGPELAKLIKAWKAAHGGAEPNQRTVWQLHQQAAQNTRRTKAQSRRTVNGVTGGEDLTDEERLAAWDAAGTDEEMTAASAIWQKAEQFARENGPMRAAPRAIPALDVQPCLLPPVPGRVVSEAALARAGRVAVAEVQLRHAAWTMAELRFEVHRALGGGVSEADVSLAAELVVSGRAGAGVVQIGEAPDVADVSELGVRESDGGSVYREPLTARWCTLGHLDVEQHIVEVARRRVPARVTPARALAAVLGTDLTPAQAEAAVALLTAETMTVPLEAAAGSGKSHVLVVFARLWTELTGGRVIGLTTSTNAAEVLAEEGMPETYNIAQFLGKVPDSDRLRHPVPVGPGDVLVVDEATQVSTADMAAVQQAAVHGGAQMHPVGDTAQLGSVDAGGIFALLAGELGGPRILEILRFDHGWEADASLQLAAGDITAVAAYQRRGRIFGADREATFDQAATMAVADRLAGRDALLVAGSNAEAADLSRRVQAALVKMGAVEQGQAELSDGNMAGDRDLIRARLNAKVIEAGGRALTNRDRLRVTGIAGDHVWAERLTGPGVWSQPFQIPLSYLASDAELDYAGNVHVAEGRTVDVSRAVITETMDRAGQYVALTRGRAENYAHVVTGNTAPKGRQPFEQATVEQVIKAVMDRDGSELSATAQMRAAQEWAGGAGHVLHLWSVTVQRDMGPQVDAQITAALTADQARRYAREYARGALHARLREAQLAGHDLGEVIARITAEDLGGARSVSSVLHSRLAGLGLDAQHDATWAQRTPDGASPLARELAEGLDGRVRELGARAAAAPEPWLAEQLGVQAPDASADLRADYERRAGVAAGYREAAGITDPRQAVAADPHEGRPELETWRRAVFRALEIKDEAALLAAAGRGELEAKVARADRLMAAAPPNPAQDLRAAAQARANAQAQAAQAKVDGNHTVAEGAGLLAARHAADQARLEEQMAAYERWSAGSKAERDLGGRALAELAARGYDRPEPAGKLTAWWAKFEQDVAEVDRALAAEHAAAVAEGRPWPPTVQARVEALAGDDTRSQPHVDSLPEAASSGTPGEGAARDALPRAAGAASSRGAQLPPPAPSPPDEPEPDEPGRDDAARRVVDLNARLDELAARTAQVRAEAEASSSDEAFLLARREAEAAAEAQPGPAAADDYEPEPG